jgi:prevent-host-death family protein
MAIEIAIMGAIMDKTYSIAEARNDLSNVVREAEAGRRVTLSRRGHPVAVVVSTAAAETVDREQIARVIAELRDFRTNCHTGKGNIDLREMIEAGRR